jgi:hypothetical protein
MKRLDHGVFELVSDHLGEGVRVIPQVAARATGILHGL